MQQLFTSTARLLRWLDIIEWIAKILLYIANAHRQASDNEKPLSLDE